MRIPVSQGPQVELAPIAGTLSVAPGIQGPSLSRAIAGALGEMNQASQEADHLRVEDQMNAARGRQLGIRQNAFQQLGAGVLPQNGKTFTDQHLGQFDTDMQKMEDGLNNNNQRRLFRQRSALLRQNLENDLQSHEAQQMKVYSDDVDLGTIDQESAAARSNVGNPSELALGQVRVDGAVNSLAKRNGWAPERVTSEREKALTQFHGSVVGAALDAGRLGYARDYLEAHKSEIAPDKRAEIRKILDSQGDVVTASTLADGLVTTYAKGKTFDLKSAVADARKQMQDGKIAPGVFAQVEANLKDQAALDEHAISTAHIDSLASMNRYLLPGGGGLGTAIKSQDWVKFQAADPTAAHDWLSRAQDEARVRANQAQADPMQNIKYAEAIYDTQKDILLGKIQRPQEISAKAMEVGPRNVPGLVDYLLKVQTSPKQRSEVKANADVLETVYRQGKGIGFGRDLKPGEKAELNAVQAVVETKMEASGQPWDRARTAQMAQEEMIPIVTNQGKQPLGLLEATTPLPPRFMEQFRKSSKSNAEIYQQFYRLLANGQIDAEGNPIAARPGFVWVLNPDGTSFQAPKAPGPRSDTYLYGDNENVDSQGKPY